MAAPATSTEEVAELLGDEVDEAILDRLVDSGATIDEIAEALEDLEHEQRFGDIRPPASRRVAEVRSILEDIPAAKNEGDHDSDDVLEGLTVVERIGEDED